MNNSIETLKRKPDFSYILTNGTKLESEHFLFLFAPSPLRCRYGIIASSKVGSAVVRNRIKRIIRLWIEEMEHKLQGYDVVVIVRKNAGAKKNAHLRCDLARFLSKIPCV